VSWWLIGGIVLAIAIVLALVFWGLGTSIGRTTGAALGRALTGRTRAPTAGPADMTFSVDAAGRYPGDAGWVDEHADD
jgi:hypothetical protein